MRAHSGRPELEHAVQHVGRGGDLGGLAAVRSRAQPVADDALPARDFGFDQGTPAVSRRPLPARAAALRDDPQVADGTPAEACAWSREVSADREQGDAPNSVLAATLAG